MKYLLPLSFLLVACGSQTLVPELFDREKAVIEIRDMYQAGQIQLDSAMVNFPSLDKVYQESSDQILVIFLEILTQDEEFERVQQSGVFIENGRFILTAGHGFDLEDATLQKVSARLVSGHELLLEVVQQYFDDKVHPSKDWAILQPVVPYLANGLGPASEKSASNDVLIIGFPGGLGHDNTGGVVHVREVERGGVYPLAVICDRLLMNPHILRPVAGAIPIRGMSGAPVINAGGDIIGLFSSVSRTRSIRGWHYIFEMSEVPWKTIDSLMKK
ncbi:trypsin-like peptidase domain-containing protein [bacterium]|nr:trypsin-like peptidase domain-containing protein [bacterium]